MKRHSTIPCYHPVKSTCIDHHGGCSLYCTTLHLHERLIPYKPVARWLTLSRLYFPAVPVCHLPHCPKQFSNHLLRLVLPCYHLAAHHFLAPVRAQVRFLLFLFLCCG